MGLVVSTPDVPSLRCYEADIDGSDAREGRARVTTRATSNRQFRQVAERPWDMPFRNAPRLPGGRSRASVPMTGPCPWRWSLYCRDWEMPMPPGVNIFAPSRGNSEPLVCTIDGGQCECSATVLLLRYWGQIFRGRKGNLLRE